MQAVFEKKYNLTMKVFEKEYNLIIKAPTKEISAKVQQAIFDMGSRWHMGERRVSNKPSVAYAKNAVTEYNLRNEYIIYGPSLNVFSTDLVISPDVFLFLILNNLIKKVNFLVER